MVRIDPEDMDDMEKQVSEPLPLAFEIRKADIDERDYSATSLG